MGYEECARARPPPSGGATAAPAVRAAVLLVPGRRQPGTFNVSKGLVFFLVTLDKKKLQKAYLFQQ